MSWGVRALSAALFVTSLAAGFGTRAFAEDACHPLTLITSVDLAHRDGDNRMYVPVSLQGKDKLMLLDTGGELIEITPQVADELGLQRRMLGFIEVNLAGETSNQAAEVSSFTIGQFTTKSIELVVSPFEKLFGNDTRYAGVIGPNVLKKYDVDIDFGAPKLKSPVTRSLRRKSDLIGLQARSPLFPLPGYSNRGISSYPCNLTASRLLPSWTPAPRCRRSRCPSPKAITV